MTTFVVPRRSAFDATTGRSDESGTENGYDTESIPVLIRLPDLNAATSTSSRRGKSRASTASPTAETAASSRREKKTHRIDDKHERPHGSHHTDEQPGWQRQVIKLASNRFVTGGALAAVIVLAYIAIQGNGTSPDPAEDTWHATNQPSTPVGVESWPTSEAAAPQLPVPTPEAPSTGDAIAAEESSLPTDYVGGGPDYASGTVQGLAEEPLGSPTHTTEQQTSHSEPTVAADRPGSPDGLDVIAQPEPVNAWPPGVRGQTAATESDTRTQLPRDSYADPPTHDASFGNGDRAIQYGDGSSTDGAGSYVPRGGYETGPTQGNTWSTGGQPTSNPHYPSGDRSNAGGTRAPSNGYQSPGGYRADPQIQQYQPATAPYGTAPANTQAPVNTQAPGGYPPAAAPRYPQTDPGTFPTPPSGSGSTNRYQSPSYRTSAAPQGTRGTSSGSILTGEIQVPRPRANYDRTESRLY